MKPITLMKKLNCLLAALIAAGTAQVASALTYSATDLLLVFRQDGFNDVEFDLGPVSAYLAQTPGTQIPVPYDLNLVRSNFNNSLTGVKFVLVAATTTSASSTDPSARVWLTDQDLWSTPGDVTYSQLSSLRGLISNVGKQATAITASNPAPCVVSSSSHSSYSQIASDFTGTFISTMYGASDFPVENDYPTTLAFYELKAPSGQPASRVGAFTLAGDGSLTFTAGQLPVLPGSTITDFKADGGFVTIAFSTTNGVNYELWSATSLYGPWLPVDGATLAGDGTVQTLTDFSADPVRFYRIKSNY